ncbi:MAG: hypothetical protein AAGD35_06475 [Actinomycetota bacterium]
MTFTATRIGIAAILVASVAVIALAVVMLGADDSDDTATDATTTTLAVGETNTTGAAAPATEPAASLGDEEEPRFELDGALPLPTAEVNEMLTFVETQTGRSFRYPPTIVAQDRGTYEAGLSTRLDEQLDEIVEEGEITARYYQTLGLSDLTPDELAAAIQAVLTSADGIGGYYDPDVDALYVPVEGEVDGTFRSVLVHELLHALDAQHVDLAAAIDTIGASDDTEAAFALTAVIEGRATAVQFNWMAANGVAVEVPELTDELAAVPAAFLNALSLPYGFGQVYVAANGGPAGTWEAYENPPSSSEQVLFPDTAATETVVDVEATADGDVLDTSVFGAADLALWLFGDSIEPSQADIISALNAADGWAGGSSVLWGDDTESCLRIVLAADTPLDLTEMEAAVTPWVEAAEGRTSVVANDLLTVTSCTPFRS